MGHPGSRGLLEQIVMKAPSRIDQYPTPRPGGVMSLLRTTDPEQSGVKLVMEQRDVNLGPVNVLSDGGFRPK